MSSLQSYPAQRKTNTFVVLYLYDDTTFKSNCYLIQERGFNQWKQDNASILSIAGNTITTSVADFPGAIENSGNGLWSSQYFTFPDFGYVAPATTLTDLGKDIFIGVPGEANLLHLRLVQAPGTVAGLGKGGNVGYVAVECNADIFITETGNSFPNVSVARVQ